MDAVYILILALLLDLTVGEPPYRFHPVVWMGKVIAFLIRFCRMWSPAAQFIWGMLVTLATIALFVTPVFFLLGWLKGFSLIAYFIVAAVLFKITFSLRGLRQAALKIKKLLVKKHLPEARFELRALVSRDCSQLNSGQMVSAVVESVAESSCDSYFAPLFFFIFLGIPGAIAYRVINTLDAMIGKRGKYEYTGKFAAKLDTVVNFIPARLAALFIIMAAVISRASAGNAWRMLRRDAGKTLSPNAGWTMSAMAGALRVQLEKVGFYKLGDPEKALETGHIDVSVKIVYIACLLFSLVAVVGVVIYNVVA
ncbi:MAG TPA: cobalamin biosynthesis protein [Dehalococcoidales bacterium]|nr:cobalamin biosynthesis protein [Dehalococcoidales bacterium]